MRPQTYLLGLLLVAAPALAILGRHDVPPEAYLVPETEFPALGRLDERIEAVLITDRWMLTAAHTVDMLSPLDETFVRLGERCVGAERIVVHPEWEGGWPLMHEIHDLALLELAETVEFVDPVALYTGDDELGSVVTLPGRGRSGNGRDGLDADADGVMRRGTNRIEAVTETTLFLVFDDPDSATDLEAVAGPGDSGGPALLVSDEETRLVGIGSATTGVPEVSTGLYGTVDLYVRVSRFAPWILGVIAGTDGGSEWNPSTSCSDVSWPDHPASRLARDFFEASETGTVEALREYFRRYDTSGDPARAERVFEALVKRFGALEVRRCTTRGPAEIRVLARTHEGSEWLSLGFTTATEEADRLGRLYMKPQRAPGAVSRCQERLEQLDSVAGGGASGDG